MKTLLKRVKRETYCVRCHYGRSYMAIHIQYKTRYSIRLSLMWQVMVTIHYTAPIAAEYVL